MSQKSKIKIILITHNENDYYFGYYPSNIKRDQISEIKSVNSIYKEQKKGYLNTSKAKFFYDSYIEEKTSNHFFILIKTDYNYPEFLAEDFLKKTINNLSEISKRNDGLLKNNNSLSNEAKTSIVNLFEIYQTVDKAGNRIQGKGRSKLTLKEEGIVNEDEDENEMIKEMNGEDGKTRNLVQRERAQTKKLKNNPYKQNLMCQEDEDNEEEDENSSKLDEDERSKYFMKDENQLLHMSYWKLYKFILLIICLILLLSFYISIPFLIKYRRAQIRE